MEDTQTSTHADGGGQAQAIAHEVAHLFEKMGNATAVFGPPMKLDTHTVIPVAVIEVGVGGGIGTGHGPVIGTLVEAGKKFIPGSGGAGGGGGSVMVRPVGYLSESDGKVVFTPIDVPPHAHAHGREK